MMNFSRAISKVKWLSGEKTNVLKAVSVLILRVLVTLRMRTEMVFEMLVFSPLNHLTWLIAQENFIIHSDLFHYGKCNVTKNSSVFNMCCTIENLLK
jgi:hypothetical protein